MSAKYENLQKVNDLEYQAMLHDVSGWLNNELFTADWWLLLAFLILPWILWSRLFDRNRVIELLLFAMFTIQLTTVLDILGTELNFWYYPTSLIPIFPRAFPFDISMVPVGLILVYQYAQTWKAFRNWLLLMAAVYAFIGEPFCVWQELVIYSKWNYFYSFLYYIVTGISIRAFIQWLKSFKAT
ncbi:CBO0543 family protein [Bacillus sp. AK031]